MIYLFKAYIRPIIEYASISYSSLSSTLSDRLERFQRKAARICLRLPLFSPVNHSSLLHHAQLPTLSSRRKLKLALFAHSIHHKHAPPHILNLPIIYSQCTYPLRHTRTFSVPTTRTDRHRDSPLYAALSIFNTLPQDVLTCKNRSAFKKHLSSLIESSVCTCSDHPTFSFTYQ